MNELLRRLRFFLFRQRFERELDEEMRHHLALLGEEQKSGQRFGNVALLKEDSRLPWTLVFWEQLAQDVRYSLRAMARNKLFTVMAALSLALGIGANTAVYSFIDAIMLRSLPVEKPEELVIVSWKALAFPALIEDHWGEDYSLPGGGHTGTSHPYPSFEFLRDHNTVLSSIFAHAPVRRLNVVADGNAQLANGELVSGGYFGGLGLSPAAGRLLTERDDSAGADPAVVLAFRYWQSRFGGDWSVVGKNVSIDGASFSIAGIAPAQFEGVSPGTQPDVFIPISRLSLLESARDIRPRLLNKRLYWVEIMGRLKPGIALPQAHAQLSASYRDFVQSTINRASERVDTPVLALSEGGSGFDRLRRQYAKPLWTLLAMVGLILALACVNIANLLLTRATARRREMALRLSLGAGRFRVVRQLLTESILLAVLGGVAGCGVGLAGIRALRILFSGGRGEFAVPVGLDWRVLAFTLTVAVGTGILFGLAPALQATRVEVTPALKESRTGSREKAFGLSQAFVVLQISISLLLVIGASLFVRTVSNLHQVKPGFNSANLLLFSLAPGSRPNQFYESLHRQFRGMPGVRGVTYTDLPLVSGETNRIAIGAAGQPGVSAGFVRVGPEFFSTMQIPLLAGRAFDRRDTGEAQPVIVVNEALATLHFPGASPLGRHLRIGEKVDAEVVGVAKNALYSSLKRGVQPVFYMPLAQEPETSRPREIFFELRTSGDPMMLAGGVRTILRNMAPDVPLSNVTTQTKQIDSTITSERTFARLCTVFGALALLMACVGLYGTLSYTVARRTGEIGIRVALGAARRSITWMVLRDVLLLAGTGIMIGLAAAWRLSVYVENFLFGLKPADPATFGLATVILVACALIAALAPAWRAATVDPVSALRHE